MTKLSQNVCYACKQLGYFVTIRTDGHHTCPFCGQPDSDSFMNSFSDNESELQFEKLVQQRTSGRVDYFVYCDACMILFTIGHTHLDIDDNESDVHYAEVISKFSLYGKSFKGMPRFETAIQAKQALTDLDNIEVVCLCRGVINNCKALNRTNGTNSTCPTKPFIHTYAFETLRNSVNTARSSTIQ